MTTSSMRVKYCVALIMLPIFMLFVQSVWAIGLQHLTQGLFSGGALLCLTLMGTAGSLLALTLFWLNQTGRNTKQYLALQKFSPKLLMVFLALLLMVGVISQMIGQYFSLTSHDFILPFLFDTPSWLLWLAVGVAVPIYEELIFRGLLWQIGERLLGHRPWLMILLNGFLFAITHLQYQPIEMGLVLMLSWVFGAARHYANSLILPIILHAINNTWVLAWVLWTYT